MSNIGRVPIERPKVIFEEVSLTDADIGTHIWTREHIIPFIDATWNGQRDVFHLVPVARALRPSTGARFAPGRLAELLRDLALARRPR